MRGELHREAALWAFTMGMSGLTRVNLIHLLQRRITGPKPLGHCGETGPDLKGSTQARNLSVREPHPFQVRLLEGP